MVVVGGSVVVVVGGSVVVVVGANWPGRAPSPGARPTMPVPVSPRPVSPWPPDAAVVVVAPPSPVVVDPVVVVVVVAFLPPSDGVEVTESGLTVLASTERNSRRAVQPTSASAFFRFFTPGSCTMTVRPWRVMSGSATPRPSTR